MRKIDKTLILAKKYKEWETAFIEGENHPKYKSSGSEFYYDIIANLIWIQKGLCAYTESLLQDCEKYSPSNWHNGCFSREDFVGNFAGQLDHYYPNLKRNQGWLWDNFFPINSDVNMKVKSTKIPIGVLKPDKVDFDPFHYLEYNIAEHTFLPSKERTIQEQEEILYDIEVLGLNWEPMVKRRKSHLNNILDEVKYEELTYEEAHNKLEQFFTAFELCRNYMQ